METLVRPPDIELKTEWLKNSGIEIEKTKYNWLIVGFAQALFAEETDTSIKNLRDFYLVNNFNTVEEMATAAELLTNSKIDKWIKLFSKDYTNFIIANTTLYEDVESTLSILKEKGHSLYLISNLMSPYKEIFNKLKLKKYFDNVFFSCDIGHKKPEEEIFNFALKVTNSSINESIVIGDNWNSDILGGLKMNLDTIYINRKREGMPNHLMSYGLKGLVMYENGKFSFKKEYLPILSTVVPDTMEELTQDLSKKVYKNENGLIQLKSLKKVKFANNLREILNF